MYSVNAKKWTDADIINFHTTMLLRDIKRLMLRTVQKISELNLDNAQQKEMPLVPFILYYLKFQLINLFFSVQEAHKPLLSDTISLEYLYLTEFKESKFQIKEILPLVKAITESTKRNSQPAKLTFGCNLKKEKLRPIIVHLCDEINLLNEDISPADELVDLLVVRNIIPGMKKIKLACDNKNFRYVIEKLKPHFDALTYINIERSQCFYSIKSEKPMASNDFSKAKSFNPKLKANIDNIFHQLQ